MKKNIITACLLGYMAHSFALSDQVMQGEMFLKKHEKILINEQPYYELKKDVKLGQKDKAILLLKKQWSLDENNIFDNTFERILKEEQESVGFSATGVLDPNTFMAIYDNSLSWQKKAVLEALKEWKPIVEKQKREGSNFIVINIPSQTLNIYELKRDDFVQVLSSRVVIGSIKERTPFENIKIKNINFNPNWTPTPGILKKNLYKDGKLNIEWIKSKGLVGIDKNGNTILPDEIMDASNLKFNKISNKNNSMGMLKFETDSNKNIYLYDTNKKDVFNTNIRVSTDNSIKVEDAVELAGWLSHLEIEDIEKQMENKTTTIEKVEPINIYFTYSQVLFNGGNTQFYSDVYNLKRLEDF